VNDKDFDGVSFAPRLKNPFQGEAHYQNKEQGHNEKQCQRFSILPQDLQFFERNGDDLANQFCEPEEPFLES
jgi:hypothetical protein